MGGGDDTGLADGQDGTLQRKTLKRSLGNESAAPPVLIMGRKEGGHGKSEPDQPGKAKLWEMRLKPVSPFPGSFLNFKASHSF